MVAQNAASRSAQSGPFNSRRKSVSITPGAITNGTVAYTEVTFAGAAIGDIVAVSFNDDLVAGILAGQATVKAAGKVRIPFTNVTGAPVTQTAITVNIGLAKLRP